MPRYFDDIEIGDEIPSVREVIAHERVMRFMQIRPRLRGDGRFTDPVEAQRIGLAGMIVPGPLIAGVMARVLGSWAEGGEISKLDLVFRRNVLQDVPVDIQGVITDTVDGEADTAVECDLFVLNSDGERLVTGAATVRLPRRDSTGETV